MTTEDNKQNVTPTVAESGPPGGLIVKILHGARDGAKFAEIVRFLQSNYGKYNHKELSRNVKKILEDGAALGFLQRKGSRYLNWEARESCGRRRRRRSSCRRRRSCGRRRSRRRRRSCRRRRGISCRKPRRKRRC